MKHQFLGIFAVLSAIFGLSSRPLAGASYPEINATTKSNLTTQTAKVQEEKWSRRIVMGADYVYNENPFGDNMSGGPFAGKAIIQITDTEKVAGNTINIPTVGGLGGPRVQGSADRIGSEQKLQVGNFQLKIGRGWYGVGFQSIARDETMIGGRLDKLINDGLRNLHAQGRSSDILLLMREYARAYPRNILLPSGTTEATIKTANVLSTSLLSQGKSNLGSLGGMPMELTDKDSGGSAGQSFMALGVHNALESLDIEDNYLQGLRLAGERGDKNPLFTGRYVDWLGTMIYRWIVKDHGNWGPVGSPLFGRAFLSAATTISIVAPTVITGGGTAAAAATTPTPLFYSFFKNSPWIYHNGDSIAGVDFGAYTPLAYFLIIDAVDSTKYACVAYAGNDGGRLQTAAADGNGAVSSGHSPLVAITGGVTTARSWAAGSLIVQCNALGVPFGFTPLFGREVIATGLGSINGSVSDPQMGKRTEEHRNHDLDHGIGAECAWGASIVQRADGVAPGFVMLQHAITVPGAPNIT